MAIWEMLLVGALAILVTMWFLPGIRESFRRNAEMKEEQKDWRGLILPLVFVTLFVLLLISLV